MNGQLPGRDLNPHDIRLLLRTDRVNNTPLHFLFRAKKEADIEDERIFQTFGFRSKKAARMACKDCESLRNNLAPAQTSPSTTLPRRQELPRALHRCTAIKQEVHAFPAFAKRLRPAALISFVTFFSGIPFPA